MIGARTFAFGSFLLFPERQLLMQGDAAVRIGGRALDLLIALVERPGELLSKAELMARVWPTTTVDEGNLKVNMAGLRRALADNPGAARYIATVTGRGYRFIAPVEARAGSRLHPAPAATLMAEPPSRLPQVRRGEFPAEAGYRTGGPPRIGNLLGAVDYGIVIGGEMALPVDGIVVLLKPGSAMARRSSRRPAADLSDAPSRMLFVRVDSDG